MRSSAANRDRAAFLAILLIGAALRLYRWGEIPNWINFDEAQVGLDALSLLATGHDHLGNRWPVYFPGWGSGLNALYLYLSLPIFWLHGLDVFSLRILQLVLGIATVPLAYLVTRRIFGHRAALVAMAMFAVLPWHVMASRWGLESNVEIPIVLGGSYTLDRAIHDRNPVFKWLTTVLWCASIYAYVAQLFILPLFAALVLLGAWPGIRAQWRTWAGCALLAALLCAPIGLWCVKNLFLHHGWAWERDLPFSAPLFPVTRFAQSEAGNIWGILNLNAKFLLFGFGDDRIWNTFPPFLALSMLVPILFFVAVAFIVLSGRWRRYLVPLAFVVGNAGLAISFPMSVHRANGLLAVAIMLAAFALVSLVDACADPRLRRAVLVATGGYLAVYAATFAASYFASYNANDQLQGWFNAGMPQAIDATLARADADEPIWVAEPNDVIAPALLLAARPDILPAFRTAADIALVDGSYHFRSVGRFRFGPDRPRPGPEPLLYVTRVTHDVCPGGTLLWRSPRWIVGRCPAD